MPASSAPPAPRRRPWLLYIFLWVVLLLVVSPFLALGFFWVAGPSFIRPVAPVPHLALEAARVDSLESSLLGILNQLRKGQQMVIALSEEEFNALLPRIIRLMGCAGDPLPIPGESQVLESLHILLEVDAFEAEALIRTPALQGLLSNLSHRPAGLRFAFQAAVAGDLLRVKVEEIRVGKVPLPTAAGLRWLAERTQHPCLLIAPDDGEVLFRLPAAFKSKDDSKDFVVTNLRVERAQVSATVLRTR